MCSHSVFAFQAVPLIRPTNMLQTVAKQLARRLGSALPAEAVGGSFMLQKRGAKWSVETEPATYKSVDEIINHELIEKTLEETKEAAKDLGRIRDILAAAKERSFLTNAQPGPSEYVQGLTIEEMGILLNTDVNNEAIMTEIFDTAFAIKERIYGNRIVLFAPLYLANYCVNNCRYCAFRAPNKGLERTSLTDQQLREEVAALQHQGHRRLLVLTGEHPKYTFDEFLHVSWRITGATKQHWCRWVKFLSCLFGAPERVRCRGAL